MLRRMRCHLLCEDREQESFFRPILERMFGRVYVEARKPKQAGGFSFVFQSYAGLVRKFPRGNPKESVGLVVVVDGDKEGRASRLEELNRRLEMAGEARRLPTDRIAACVPTRNVETWELWLCGRHDLNEFDDYRADFQALKKTGPMSSRQAAKAWFHQTSQAEATAEGKKLPSLVEARAELERLSRMTG